VLVAFKANGEALRKEHGYPVRLVVPGWEGNMWVKWLRRIEVTDRPVESREQRGRDPRGPIPEPDRHISARAIDRRKRGVARGAHRSAQRLSLRRHMRRHLRRNSRIHGGLRLPHDRRGGDRAGARRRHVLRHDRRGRPDQAYRRGGGHAASPIDHPISSELIPANP
jgi:hypothetical protein